MWIDLFALDAHALPYRRDAGAAAAGGCEPAVRDDDGPVLRLRLFDHGAARQEARLALHAPLPHAPQVLGQPPGKKAEQERKRERERR